MSEERKQKFIELINAENDYLLGGKKYPSAMIEEFVDYWCECNMNGRKMRFEKEKTFDISRRLKTFYKNALEWGKDYAKDSQPKIDENKLRL